MRTKLSVLAALAAIVFAGTAQANSVSLIWQTSGTDTTEASPSSTITANVVLQITGATIQTITWSVEWDADLTLTASFCDNTVAGGISGSGFCLLGQGVGNQESSWAYSDPSGLLAPGTITAGTVTFHVSSAASDGIDVTPTFNNTAAGDGCNGGACNGLFTLNGAEVNPVPEPGTVALLSLGLVGLGLMGRRSR